ncbi:retron St85 family RNA-directed DNA polymerase [Stenotrophomonas sp. LARHCG68]
MNRADFVNKAAKLLRTSNADIEKTLNLAPYMYKEYTIAKRSGGRRKIHHPSPTLKALQRLICDEVIADIQVHPSVMSYVKGRSIRDNAIAHISSNFVTRLDFKDFFPSITAHEVKKHLESQRLAEKILASSDLIDVLVKLVCRHDKVRNIRCLSIGAPSSPQISNSLLYGLDTRATEITKSLDCIYTRYADDIYISGRSRENQRRSVQLFLEAAKILLPFLEINNNKTQNLSRKRRITVTGLILTTDRKISIGRDLKRSLKTQVFLFSANPTNASDASSLRGMLAYANGVEPEFIISLRRKFGGDLIDRILSGH